MKYNFILPVFLLLGSVVFGQNIQETIGGGRLTGNVQVDAQVYRSDSAIGAKEVPQKFLSNAFANLLYTNGPISAGARFESYLDPMLGYDPMLAGVGVPYRFARFSGDFVDVTVGSFYDQFGSGLIFRSYEDWNLGMDNAMDGVRVIINPANGITIKSLVGKQRYFWEKTEGIIRGLDADVALNDLVPAWREAETRLTVGGSFVSRYQASVYMPVPGKPEKLILPENVGSFAGRFNLESGRFSLGGEYVWKDRDPSADNNYIYKTGQALLLNAGYSQKGFSVLLSAKSVDNMGYRANRQQTGNWMMINYLPALSKTHGYALTGFYPYACQSQGEVGYQADVNYKVPKGTLLGGKYGMDVKLNYSLATSIEKKAIDANTSIGQTGTLGYKSSLFASGDEIYFSDFNVELARRFGRKVKASVTYMNLVYNKAVVENHFGDPTVYANIGVAEISYLFDKKNAIRFEGQYMSTKQDDGDWMMATLEYTISPSWFFSVSDMYNHGNKKDKLHYYSGSVGYVKGASRVALSYGRIREGIVCAGGVCRVLPASNGLMVTVTTSF